MAAGVAIRPQSDFALRPRAQARQRIAFVCWGNSCRSQMAEAWARHLARDSVEAVSAGVSPLGFITPETLRVMEEKNVSLEGQQSKGLEAIDWQQVDVLVNMSPLPTLSVVPGFHGQRLQWKVTDPFGRSLRVHRKVRDLLERKVRDLLVRLQESGSLAPPVA